MRHATATRMPSLANKLHAHGCSRCDRRMEDTCGTPTVDLLCFTCRTGQPASALMTEGRLPQDCCFENCREANPAERATYRLAGTRIWSICRTCQRTHPKRPWRKPNAC